MREVRLGIGLLTLALFIGCESADVNGNFWELKEGSDAAPAETPSNGGAAATTTESSSDASGSGSSSEDSSGSATDSSSSSSSASDQVSFGSLRFNYGGFRGERASLSAARISGLKISGHNLGYSWAGPTLSSWGLSSGEAGALACLFVQNNSGSWVGGKFDWISTSRTTRNLENVFYGYNGWSLRDVPNPCKAAFVIVSSDGRRRTNVITTTWAR